MATVAIFLLVLLGASPTYAHVGGSGVYAEGNAGPYKLFVSVQPPTVIPGVANVQVRTSASDIHEMSVAAMPLTGAASKHLPAANRLRRSDRDPEFYSGSLWIMAGGSWQLRFLVNGLRGNAELTVPLAAAPTAVRKMGLGLGALLVFLGVVLVLGMVGIVGAGIREAQLGPGKAAPTWRRRRAAVAMAAALVVLLFGVWFGGKWWRAEAAGYAKRVYKPLNMQATLLPNHQLDLALSNPNVGAHGWMRHRKIDDFILDHGHPMHLYMIREPGFDMVFHLHPWPSARGHFRLNLPSMPAGTYRLYADVVHADGFPETLLATVKLPAIAGRALSGDDAEGLAPPLSKANDAQTIFRLPDGYVMVWAKPPVLKALQPQIFKFYLLDPLGRPPADMALYMGMLGHAAFVRSDGQVFAHVHPSGTAPMAAMMLAHKQSPGRQNATPMSMQMPMQGATGQIPNHVGFPYAFPTPGQYRIFVQMKHGTTIETAAFDAEVTK